MAVGELNPRSSVTLHVWLSMLDLNQRPFAYRANALPTELMNSYFVTLNPTDQRSRRKNQFPSFLPKPILHIRLSLSSGNFVTVILSPAIWWDRGDSNSPLIGLKGRCAIITLQSLYISGRGIAPPHG